MLLIGMCPICGDDAEFSVGWRRLGGHDKLEIAMTYIMDNRFDLMLGFYRYAIQSISS